MERPRRRQPSQYQMGFDFGQRPDEVSLVDVMRFTYAVKEEVQVVSPEVAGAYLLSHVYSPFEAFEHEESDYHQSMIYRGTINTAQIRIAELYKPALRLNVTSIITS